MLWDRHSGSEGRDQLPPPVPHGLPALGHDVDGTANDVGMNPFGPMPMESQPQRPDFAKVLPDTDTEIDSLLKTRSGVV